MAQEIRWTPESIVTFDKIIEYLIENWGEKEVVNFVSSTDKVIDYISEYPRMFRKTNRKNVHEALITPHNLLIYKITSTHISLLTFWDTRQLPAKK